MCHGLGKLEGKTDKCFRKSQRRIPVREEEALSFELPHYLRRVELKALKQARRRWPGEGGKPWKDSCLSASILQQERTLTLLSRLSSYRRATD